MLRIVSALIAMQSFIVHAITIVRLEGYDEDYDSIEMLSQTELEGASGSWDYWCEVVNCWQLRKW